MKIIRDDKACYGCRSCELVCSFHHEKVFSPRLSSIKFSRNNRTADISWAIDSTCDSCKGELRPLCVEYCLYGALREVR